MTITYKTSNGTYNVDFSVNILIELIDAKDVISVEFQEVEVKKFSTKINKTKLVHSISNNVSFFYMNKEKIVFCKGYYNQINKNFVTDNSKIIFDNKIICYKQTK